MQILQTWVLRRLSSPFSLLGDVPSKWIAGYALYNDVTVVSRMYWSPAERRYRLPITWFPVRVFIVVTFGCSIDSNNCFYCKIASDRFLVTTNRTLMSRLLASATLVIYDVIIWTRRHDKWATTNRVTYEVPSENSLCDNNQSRSDRSVTWRVIMEQRRLDVEMSIGRNGRRRRVSKACHSASVAMSARDISRCRAIVPPQIGRY